MESGCFGIALVHQWSNACSKCFTRNAGMHLCVKLHDAMHLLTLPLPRVPAPEAWYVASAQLPPETQSPTHLHAEE